MKIICNKEEAAILIRNCKHEHCEFCFLKEVCHDTERGSSINQLIEIRKDE